MTTTAPRKRAARKPRVVAEPVVEAVEPVVDDEPVLEVEEQKAKYIAKRKLTFRGREYQAGDPVPGAEEIQRIETWVVHGYLKEA